MKFFLKITFAFLIALLFSIYFISSKILTEHTEEIEKLIYNQTSINTKIDTLSLSFLSFKAKKLEFFNENINVKIDELNVTPNSYISILKGVIFGDLNFNNKFIKKIKAKNVVITTKNINIESSQLTDSLDETLYSDILNMLKPIELIDIQTIQINNFKLKDTKFMYADNEKKFHIETEAVYLNNIVKISGNIDLAHFLQTGKINTQLKGSLQNINLAYLSQFISDDNLKILSGNINGEFNLDAVDSKITINSNLSLNKIHTIIWGKDFSLKDLNLTATLKENTLSFNLINQPILNSTELDINEISLSLNDQYEPEKIYFKSNHLIYSGYFSKNFIKNTNKQIKFDFNLIDLSYFNKLKVLDIPKPLSDSLAENGQGIVDFKKNKNKYEITYFIKAKTSLNIEGVKLESEAVIQNNKLTFEHFIVNGINKKSKLSYNLISDDFNFTLNDTINSQIYFIADNIFKLDLGIKSFNKEPTLNLIINRRKNNYYYNGHVVFYSNNLDYDYEGSYFQLQELKGNLYFNKSGISNSDLYASSIKHNDILLLNTNFKLKQEKEHFNLKLNNSEINGEIDYQERTDDLRIYLNNLNYKLTKEETKKILKENESSINKIKSIVLPKKLFVKLNNLKLSGKNLGDFEIFSSKNAGIYGILTKINSPYWEGNISSNLNESNNLNSNFEITVKDPKLLSESLEIKKILKDTPVLLKGRISTNLNNIEYNHIISNLNGDISLEARNGEFIDLNSGVGTILSILNFRTIPDIVTLDFKNVFNNNLQFDKINSKISITQGLLKIEEGNIKSKISDISFNGNINIAQEILNLKLEVTPKISNSILFTTVTLATGFNPVTMIGSSLLEKIIPMPNIIKYRYNINGNFEEPTIKKL